MKSQRTPHRVITCIIFIKARGLKKSTKSKGMENEIQRKPGETSGVFVLWIHSVS